MEDMRFHSQNSIQGRWKAEIRLESPKPVFLVV